MYKRLSNRRRSVRDVTSKHRAAAPGIVSWGERVNLPVGTDE